MWCFMGHSSKSDLIKYDVLSRGQKKLDKSLLKRIDFKGTDITRQPLYKQSQNYISQLLTPGSEAQRAFEAPAMRQFNEQIVPGIAERFSGLGAQSSSAFGQTMGQAGSSLSERLASMRQSLAMGALPQAFSMAQAPSQQNFNYAQLAMGHPAFGYMQRAPEPQEAPGIGQQATGALAGGIGTGLGAFGGMGIFSGLSKLFGF
jgi:hypothetical protein